MAGQEEVPPEPIGDPGADGPGYQEATDDVAQHGCPLHDEDVRHGGEALCRAESLPEGPAGGDAHVHGGVALHRAGQSLVGLATGFVQHPLAQEQAEQDGKEHDHQWTADEFRQGELPAEQQRQDDAEFDDQVGGGDLERHRGSEAGPLAKQRTGQRNCRVGTR